MKHRRFQRTEITDTPRVRPVNGRISSHAKRVPRISLNSPKNNRKMHVFLSPLSDAPFHVSLFVLHTSD